MTLGSLYGIGVGPGDPELLTVRGARLLAQCRHVFVPKARTAVDSLALQIAARYVTPGTEVHELVFPMTADRAQLAAEWEASAAQVAEVLKTGADACFLTLGDPLLYSTYIYLVRAVRAQLPAAHIVTVPGVTAFSAAAALTDFAVGEAKQPVRIIPTADDLTAVRSALAAGGTVVLMKIGKRLGEILQVLEAMEVLDRSVFVSRAGLPDQRVETDLRALRDHGPETGYLSIILVHAGEGAPP